MDINEIISAISGPGGAQPAQPEGDPNPQSLNQLGPDRTGAEQAPANVTAAQGAGSGNTLTPGAQGNPSDGTPQAGAGDGYADQGGPEQLPASGGMGALTPGPANRPEGGDVGHAEPAGAAVDPRLAAGGGTGQGINPMLKPQGAPKSSGLFK